MIIVPCKLSRRQANTRAPLCTVWNGMQVAGHAWAPRPGSADNSYSPRRQEKPIPRHVWPGVLHRGLPAPHWTLMRVEEAMRLIAHFLQSQGHEYCASAKQASKIIMHLVKRQPGRSKG
eukprot:scaffold31885_cov18-Tisochrysis_lutea.AAC.2